MVRKSEFDRRFVDFVLSGAIFSYGEGVGNDQEACEVALVGLDSAVENFKAVESGGIFAANGGVTPCPGCGNVAG